MALTVQQLINQLKMLPEDALVLVDGYEDGLSEIRYAKLVNVKLNVYQEDYYGPHQISNLGAVNAVYLPRDPNKNS